MASSFVVDASLRAVPLSRLLEVRRDLHLGGTITPTPPVGDDKPVLEGDAVLAVGTPYPASNQPSKRYYLPQYRIATDAAGKPQVTLRYQASDTEVGRLSIALTWTPLTDPSATMVVMDHVAQLTLVTQIAVDGASQPLERTIALQPAQLQGDATAVSTTVFTDAATFESAYLAMREASRPCMLRMTLAAEVAVRTWRQHVIAKPTLELQSKVLRARGALFTETIKTVAAPEAEAPRVRADAVRATLMASTTASPTILLAPTVMTRMRIPTPVPAPAPPAPPVETGVRPELSAAVLRSAVLAHSPMVARMRPVGRIDDAPIGAGPRPSPEPPPPPATPPTPPPPVAAPLPIKIAALRPALSEINTLHAIDLREVAAKSDLKIAGRAAIPALVALDEKRRPALVDSRLETTVAVPFHFDPAAPANDTVYLDAGFQGVGIHLIRRMALTDAAGTAHVAFRDSLMPDVVLIPPSEFRLSRDDTAPFLPSLSFLPTDFEVAEGDGAGTTVFRMAIGYRLTPWIDPAVSALAYEAMAHERRTAQLQALVPRSASLRLQADMLGDGAQRSGARIDPDTGIDDTLEVDEGAFTALWRQQLAPPGGAVMGIVEYELFDGTRASIPARLSLREPSSRVFDVAFVGALDAAAGRYQVTIRNRVESPVVISALPGVALGEGAVAHAVDAASHLGQTLAPLQTRVLEYRVDPPTVDVLELVPVVIGTPEPDVLRLFSLLTISPGFGSRSFTVPVRVAAGVFTVRPDQAPLTGVLVEFDDGSRVTLTPSQPQADVTVIGRLLDRLQGLPDDAQRYFFRVTNLHADGEGARTAWSERHGGGVLEVGTASGNMMDF